MRTQSRGRLPQPVVRIGRMPDPRTARRCVPAAGRPGCGPVRPEPVTQRLAASFQPDPDLASLGPFASGMFDEPSRPDAPEAPQPHAERFGGLREGLASGDLFRMLPASASGRRGEPWNPSSQGVRTSPPAVHRLAGPRSGRLRAWRQRKGLDSAPRLRARQRAARTSSSRLADAHRCRVAAAGAACVHRRKRIPRGRACRPGAPVSGGLPAARRSVETAFKGQAGPERWRKNGRGLA